LAQHQQPRLSLAEFTARYGTEQACRAALFAARWPDGFHCPRCKGTRAYELQSRPLYQCADCGHQVSVTAGTIFHHSRVPLTKWFLAMYLNAESKRGISATELQYKIGVSYPTAWFMLFRLRSAMGQREARHLLRGVVQIDDAYYGGEGHGRVGRGTRRPKAVVAVSVTDHEVPLHLKIVLVPDFTQQTINEVVTRFVEKGTKIISDGLNAFGALEQAGFPHQAVPTNHLPDGAEPFPVVHTQIANSKAWIGGTFHGLGPKHLQSYLDEFCFRFNRRRLRSVFERLVIACATSTPAQYPGVRRRRTAAPAAA
jgi:transposase-like protein